MQVKSIKHIIYSYSISILFACSSEETKSADSNDTNDQEVLIESAEPATKEIGENVVKYAGTLIGTPYKEAGKDTTGFDCSGFIYYVFKEYQIEVPHSSRHLAELGKEIQPERAKPGDLIFFRGTDPTSTGVGHVGIVVSDPGEPLKFIHASSAKTGAHVKYDSLAKPNYSLRFLKVKRVL